MGKSRYSLFKERLESLPDDERQRALSTNQGQAYLYAQAVDQQARRLRRSTSVTHVEHQADAVLFTFALRAMLSLGELALHIVPESERSAVETAMDQLRAAAPDTRDARDALAHLDEYIVGFGKQQQQAARDFLPWFSRNGEEYTVRVGPLAIEVDAAAAAAIELASAIILSTS